MRDRWVLACTLALWASHSMGCAAEVDVDGALGAAREEIIINEANWNLLTSFDGSTSLRVAARYGRATAAVDSGGCSAFLISDDVLVTARHCATGAPINAWFGRYGTSAGSTDTGEAEARNRLIQLGIPAATADATSSSGLRRFTCTLTSSPAGRDIDYYRCAPNVYTYSAGGAAYSTPVFPGELWGHFEVARTIATGAAPCPSVDTNLWALSANRRCGDTGGVSVLLTPPGVVDSVSVDCSEDEFGSCFSTTLDWVGGSSGGAIGVLSSNRVFGVVQGAHWGGGTTAEANDACESWSAYSWNYNMGSYIGPDVTAFLDEAASGSPTVPLGSATQDVIGGWIGQASGTVRDLHCPSTHVAAGIVGSTAPDGTPGNLGLVCVPARHDRRRLDRALVVAGGGHGIAPATTPASLNVYTHESLTPAGAPQAIATCPLGMLMTGVIARQTTASVLERIEGITCRDPRTGGTEQRSLGARTGRIGTAATATRTTQRACPSGMLVEGIITRTSSTDTNGAMFRCRAEGCLAGGCG